MAEIATAHPPSGRSPGNRIPTLGLTCLLVLLVAPMGRGEPQNAEPPTKAEFHLERLQGGWYTAPRIADGRVLVLTFWRPGQEQSVLILNDLVRIREELSKTKVEIVGIVSGETDRQEVARIVAEAGVDFPVLFDPGRAVYGQFGVIVSPSTWFVDGGGIARLDYPGRRRDFSRVARANVAFLLGEISEQERSQRTGRRAATTTTERTAPEARLKLARRLEAKGNHIAAERQLRIAWEATPPLPEAALELALLMLEDDRNEEALQILEKAKEFAPEPPLATGAKGVALIRLGRQNEGLRLLRDAIDKGADAPLLHYELAKTSECSGDSETAMRHYRLGFEKLLEQRRQE